MFETIESRDKSVLDQVCERIDGADAEPAAQVDVKAQMLRLQRLLNDRTWLRFKHGRGFIRSLGRMVEQYAQDPSALNRFIEKTFDHRHGKFRPYRISEWLRKHEGIDVSNHTIKAMLEKLEQVGRGERKRGAWRPSLELLTDAVPTERPFLARAYALRSEYRPARPDDRAEWLSEMVDALLELRQLVGREAR